MNQLKLQIATLEGENEQLSEEWSNRHSQSNAQIEHAKKELKKVQNMKDEVQQQLLDTNSKLAQANLKSRLVDQMCKSSTELRQIMEKAAQSNLEQAEMNADAIANAVERVTKEALQNFEKESGSMISGFMSVMSNINMNRAQICDAAVHQIRQALEHQQVTIHDNVENTIRHMNTMAIVQGVEPAFYDFKRLMYVGWGRVKELENSKQKARSFVSQLLLIHERAAIILLAVSVDQWKMMDEQMKKELQSCYVEHGKILLCVAHHFEVMDVIGEDYVGRVTNNVEGQLPAWNSLETLINKPILLITNNNNNNNGGNNNNNNNQMMVYGSNGGGANFHLAH